MIYSTQLEKKIFDMVIKTLLNIGFDIVRVKIMSQKKSKILQIMLDRCDGEAITVDDCQKASREMSVLLDVEEFISERYSLEVSSAGLNRPLTRQKDFENNIGNKVRISTKTLIENRRRFEGEIAEVNKNVITIDLLNDDLSLQIDFDSIAEAQLKII